MSPKVKPPHKSVKSPRKIAAIKKGDGRATKKPLPKAKSVNRTKKAATAKKPKKRTNKATIRNKHVKPTTKGVVIPKRNTGVIKKPTKKIGKLPSDLFVLTDHEKILLEQHKKLKLQIELVPNSCWYSNVRSNVTISQWDKIRKGVYAKANYLCQICGGKGTAHPVECHEVWVYDEDTLTQRLSHFQAICPLCHEVKHIGLAGKLGNGERATNRFRQVNNLDVWTTEEILSAVWKQWRIRSRENWGLDVELLKAYDIDINALEDRSKLKQR